MAASVAFFCKVLSPNDAGLVDSSIYSKDNELYLENDMKQTTEGYIGWDFDRFDGNSFVTDCTIGQNGNGIALIFEHESS